MIVLGLLSNTMFSGFQGFINSLIGTLIGLAIFFPLFYFKKMGAGDIKLLAAIGAIKGYIFVLWVVFYGAIVGGIISLVLLLRNQVSFSNAKSFFYSLYSIFVTGLKFWTPGGKYRLIPYGFCLSLGGLLAYWIEKNGGLEKLLGGF